MKIELKDVMLGYADPSTHHYLRQWEQGLKAVQRVLDFMRPDMHHKAISAEQQKVFDALVAGQCYLQASGIITSDIGLDLGCSHSEEFIIRTVTEIITRLADEDQAKQDKATTE